MQLNFKRLLSVPIRPTAGLLHAVYNGIHTSCLTLLEVQVSKELDGTKGFSELQQGHITPLQSNVVNYTLLCRRYKDVMVHNPYSFMCAEMHGHA